MRAWLWGGLFLLCAGPLAAQTVTVRSGEHADFSRLVFRMPSGTDWQLGRSETGYVISLQGTPIEGFDISRAFDLIPRDRVRDLRPVEEAAGDLQIDMDCLCHAEAFLFRPDMLVVDIRDGDAPEGSVFEQPLVEPVAAPEPTQNTLRPVEHVAGSPPEPTLLPLLFDRPDLHVTEDEPAEVEPVESVHLDEESTAHQDRVTAASETLLAQIGRAASQGLLDPAVEAMPVIPAPVEVPLSGQAEAPAPPVATTAPEPLDHITLHADTRIDRDIGLVLENLPRRTLDGDACYEDDDLAINTWAEDKPFPEQIGALREHLIGEFDSVSADAATELVKFYLHFGFGIEAIRIMEMLNDPLAESELYTALAAIMDQGQAPADSPLVAQLACDTHAALWASLAQETLPKGEVINTLAVLRGFKALPGHLKRYLGPVLSDRFVVRGDMETARMILKDMSLTPGDHEARATLSEARLDVADGAVEEGAEQFDEVAEQNNNLISAEAVIALVDTLIDTNQPILDDTAILAGSLAFEYRNHPLGSALAQTEALALAGTGRYAQALGRLDGSAFSADLVEETRESIAKLIHKNAPDAEFAALVAGELLPTSATLSRTTSFQVASRLADLGLHASASAYLAASDRQPPTNAESLLTARIALATDDPEEAIRQLIHLRTDEADDLRAEAFLAIGAFDQAGSIYADRAVPEQSDLAAFRGGDWDTLAQSEAEGRRALADLLLAPDVALPTDWSPDEDEEDQRVLSETRNLLQRSSHTRKTVAEALENYPVDPVE